MIVCVVEGRYVYHVCVCVCVGAQRGHKRISHFLKLEFEMVNHPVWVLGTETCPLEAQQVLLTTEPNL